MSHRNYDEHGDYLAPGPAFRWSMRGVALVGLGLSLLLAGISSNRVDFACEALGGLIFNCRHLRQSPWSFWLGMPVAVPGAVLYAGVFAALWGIGPRIPKRVAGAAWRVLVVLVVAVGLAALWFILRQAIEAHRPCLACLLVQACGLSLLAAVRWRAPLRLRHRSYYKPDPVKIRRPALVLLTSTGACVAGVLILGQTIANTPRDADRYVHTYPPVPVWLGQSPGTPGSPGAPRTPTTPGGASVAPVPGTPTTTSGTAGGTPRVTASTTGPATRPRTADVRPTPLGPPTTRVALIADDSARLSTTSATFDNPETERLRSFLGNRLRVNPRHYPILGSPDAPHVLLAIMDYKTAGSAGLQQQIDQTRRRYGGRIAVLVVHLPLDASCNRLVERTDQAHADAGEYVRLALAVWREKPEAFAAYHGWLLASEPPPSLGEARAEAARVLGAPTLERALPDSRFAEQIERNVTVYHLAERGLVPKLLFANVAIWGKPPSADFLFQKLEEKLHIKPAGS